MSIERPNYTQIPNVFLDEKMPSLSGSAFKVLMAISRKTFGYHKERDRISLSQLRKLTGISSNATLYKAVAELGETVTKTVEGQESFWEVTVTETVADRDSNCSGTATETVDTKEKKETSKEKTLFGEPASNHRSKKKHEIVYRVAFDPKDGCFSGIDEQMMKDWEHAYPDIDIPLKIDQLSAWLMANPDRTTPGAQRCIKNYEKFLVNCFSRDQKSSEMRSAS